MMLESTKRRNKGKTTKILLTINKDVLKILTRLKPRGITKQEAIRQIVEHYVLNKDMEL